MIEAAQDFASVESLPLRTTSPFLPELIDESGRYTVVLDQAGFCLLLVEQALLSGPGPLKPIWVLECADEPTMLAASRWMAVRRRHWAQWAELAHARGALFLDDQLRQAITVHPLRHVTSIQLYAGEQNEIALCEVFEGGGAKGIAEVVRHRFRSAGERSTFITWFMSQRDHKPGWSLVQIAYSSGTAELGRVLDEIASQMSGANLGAAAAA